MCWCCHIALQVSNVSLELWSVVSPLLHASDSTSIYCQPFSIANLTPFIIAWAMRTSTLSLSSLRFSPPKICPELFWIPTPMPLRLVCLHNDTSQLSLINVPFGAIPLTFFVVLSAQLSLSVQLDVVPQLPSWWRALLPLGSTSSLQALPCIELSIYANKLENKGSFDPSELSPLHCLLPFGRQCTYWCYQVDHCLLQHPGSRTILLKICSSMVRARGSLLWLGMDMLLVGWFMGEFWIKLTVCMWVGQFGKGVIGWGSWLLVYWFMAWYLRF